MEEKNPKGEESSLLLSNRVFNSLTKISTSGMCYCVQGVAVTNILGHAFCSKQNASLKRNKGYLLQSERNFVVDK
jgi:hypothetical protein